MPKAQTRHADISLGVACFAALLSAVGVGVGAYFCSGILGAEATIAAVQLQIKLDRKISQQSQPVNVMVNMPEVTPSEMPIKK